ncbi:hypothetical protein [Streptomyces sp. NPDC018347]|uniref:hypothetical protein n=1 Tax=Streptomyces sp. NPDC018347 TaxID=3157193 RepID=UPI0033F4870A
MTELSRVDLARQILVGTRKAPKKNGATGRMPGRRPRGSGSRHEAAPERAEADRGPVSRAALSPIPRLKPVAARQRVRHHPPVIVMQPVLEIVAADDFALWPIGEPGSYDYLVLDGELTPAEIGTAVMRIASCNDFEPEEEHGPCPTDPLGTFLHGLLTMPDLFAAGGFRVTDTATGTVFVEPGCCSGLESWRDWLEVLDGIGCCYFGHDPSSMAERVDDTVRLTFDVHGEEDSPVVELPVDQVRMLVTGAQRDLRDFLSLAGSWAEQHLPAQAAAVTAALARALDPGLTP